MNRTYNIVWNAARNMYVVASELSRGDSRMKTQVRSVAAMVLLALSPLSAQAESTSEVTNAMVTGETVDASDRQHSYSSGMAISAYSGSPLDKGASLKAQVDNVLELESGNAYILNGESQSFDSVSVGVE